jgi:hypothetical protein
MEQNKIELLPDEETIELIKLCQGSPIKITWNGEVTSWQPSIPNNPSISEIQKQTNSSIISAVRLAKYKFPELHMYFDIEGKYMNKNSNIKATRLMQFYGETEDILVGDVIIFPSWYIL